MPRVRPEDRKRVVVVGLVAQWLEDRFAPKEEGAVDGRR